MKIFLSALENGQKCSDGTPLAVYMAQQGVQFRWNLMSYYYIRTRHELAEFVRDKSEEIMIDSGAHSFQKGKKVDWVEYTKEYAAFIEKFDRPNVVGYFEMDVDNILGYKKVLELRAILEAKSDKIIPVWHKNRGIEDFKKTCQHYAGRVVAITGFRNEDITDDQYVMFVKYAKKYGCKVHCLGMTRTRVLDKVPFDYTDSSSWKQQAIYGNMPNRQMKVSKEFSHLSREVVMTEWYKQAKELQDRYYIRWRSVCKD